MSHSDNPTVRWFQQEFNRKGSILSTVGQGVVESINRLGEFVDSLGADSSEVSDVADKADDAVEQSRVIEEKVTKGLNKAKAIGKDIGRTAKKIVKEHPKTAAATAAYLLNKKRKERNKRKKGKGRPPPPSKSRAKRSGGK